MDADRPDTPPKTPATDAAPPRGAGPLAVASAVLGSFLGIRKARDLDADARSITPVQAIIGGLVGAALLVVGLIALVAFVTRG
ncbi:MAG: DUF2970 domain-containing protein [bacterium]|jgi:hypothetical protein|nr:DUF2970 domain-containing protein [Betaproteobacteria bacterium]